MYTELFEKSTKLEEILLDKQQHIVWYPKMFIIPKNFDVPHATAGSSPLFKTRKLKLKQTGKHDSKDSQMNYLYTRQKNSNKLKKNKAWEPNHLLVSSLPTPVDLAIYK